MNPTRVARCVSRMTERITSRLCLADYTSKHGRASLIATRQVRLEARSLLPRVRYIRDGCQAATHKRLAGGSNSATPVHLVQPLLFRRLQHLGCSLSLAPHWQLMSSRGRTARRQDPRWTKKAIEREHSPSPVAVFPHTTSSPSATLGPDAAGWPASWACLSVAFRWRSPDTASACPC